MSRFLRLVQRVLALIALTLALSAPVWAQTASLPATEPSANDIQELTRLLGDPRIQDWLKSQADGLPPADAAPSARAQFREVVQRTGLRVDAIGQAWSQLGNVPDVLASEWRAQLTPAVQVRSLTFVLIFLFVGSGLEWLLRQYTNPIRKRIEAATYHASTDRLQAAGYRTGLAFLGLAIFALGSIGTFSALSWPPLLQTVILNALIVIVSTRATGAILLLFLAPRVEQLRLIPISTATAHVLWRVLTTLVALFLICIAVVDIFSQLAGGVSKPEVLAVAVLSAFVFLLLVLSSMALCFRRGPQTRSRSLGAAQSGVANLPDRTERCRLRVVAAGFEHHRLDGGPAWVAASGAEPHDGLGQCGL